jgi:hypothetical protein
LDWIGILLNEGGMFTPGNGVCIYITQVCVFIYFVLWEMKTENTCVVVVVVGCFLHRNSLQLNTHWKRLEIHKNTLMDDDDDDDDDDDGHTPS